MMAIDRAPQVDDRVLITQSGLFDGAEGVITGTDYDVWGRLVFHVLPDGRTLAVSLYVSEFEVRR